MENLRNITTGTTRLQRSLPALDPTQVQLDDSSPADLVAEAIGLAQQLRFIAPDVAPTAQWDAIVAAATQDWSGFLGKEGGPIHQEFERFFAAPETYITTADSALAQPHVALFAAFLHILRHARAELNAFTQRHLDHYFREELQLQLIPAQPAEAYVTFELKRDAEPMLLPAGTRLLATAAQASFETTDLLELHAGSLDRRSSLRVQFELAGFRGLFQGGDAKDAMDQVRTIVWQAGLGTKVAALNILSLDDLAFAVRTKAQLQRHVSELLHIGLEDLQVMMDLAPAGWPLSVEEERVLEKWEGLMANLLIEQAFPSANPVHMATGSDLQKKLEAALFNGHSLPDYRGMPLDLQRVGADLREGTTTEAGAAALHYVRNTLWLEESDFTMLMDMPGTNDGLPKVPAAIERASIRKAANLSPWLVKAHVHRVGSAENARTQTRHGGSQTSAWFPFGLLDGKQFPGQSIDAFGMLIESPVLAMAEGERTITLGLHFTLADMEAIAARFDLSPPSHSDWKGPFEFWVSGEKDWLQANWRLQAPVIDHNAKTLTFQLFIDDSQPSVTAPGAKFPDEALIGHGPMLSIRLSHQEEDDTHQFLQGLHLDKIDLSVKVVGLQTYQASSLDGPLKVSAPYYPFGLQAGPHTAMMIAHPELCLKDIASLEMHMEWLDLPADLEAYYAPYFATMGDSVPAEVFPHATEDFTLSVNLVTGRWKKAISTEPVPFFVKQSPIDTEVQVSIPLNDMNELGEFYSPAQIAGWSNPEDWPRYMRLDYGGEWYPQRVYEAAQRRLSRAIAKASEAVSQAGADVAAGVQGAATTLATAKAKLNQLLDMDLPAPYVPQLKSMRLGYTASAEIPLATWDRKPQRKERIHHRLPFGTRELPVGLGSSQPILPLFDHAGSVLIGFSQVEAGAILSLLVQVQPGSGDPDVAAPYVNWWYNAHAGWRQLPMHALLDDGTMGLTQTGLLRIQLPSDAALSATEMPGQLFWIKATTAQDCAPLPDWNDIHLHAVKVRQTDLADAPDAPWKFSAGAIDSLERYLPNVTSVSQPYDTFGGKPTEDAGEFYRRVSERLRHKNRAVNIWDYEHLCLTHFPALYAAKCLPSKSSAQVTPGSVEVVVIPDLRNRTFADPFQPKLGYGELQEVSAFLKAHAPMTARVAARNPRYRPLRVGSSVRFREGISAATGKYLLQQRLKRFLAPWAFDQGASLKFGGRVYVSEIVDVIQSEPYVSFVGRTRISVGKDGGEFKDADKPSGDSSAYIEIEDDEVYTSVETHYINEIDDEDVQDEIWGGISWMVIGTDFVIADDPETVEGEYDEWIGISWHVVGADFTVGNSTN